MRVGVIFAVVLGMLAVAPAGHAANNEDSRGEEAVGPTLNLGVPDSSELSQIDVRQTPSAANGAVRAAAATNKVYSPARCTGQTNYPHKSGNYASVHGRMKCKYVAGKVSTTTRLARDRWYGLESLRTRTSTRTNHTTSTDATPHYYCKGQGTYSYRGYSTHYSVEGGKTYRAGTSNWQLPGKSRFKC